MLEHVHRGFARLQNKIRTDTCPTHKDIKWELEPALSSQMRGRETVEEARLVASDELKRDSDRSCRATETLKRAIGPADA